VKATAGRLLTAAMVVSSAAAGVETIHPDEISPGMTGYGLSVFGGRGVERFSVEVIDVMHDVSPGRDMVLARLAGMGLEESGVIAGMSGSPVYLDGRLAGAVAYGWSFSKEPIAGITPIGEMLELWDMDPSEQDGSPRLTPSPSRESGLSPLPVPLALTGCSPRIVALAAAELARHGFSAVTRAGTVGAGLGRDPDTLLVPGGAIGVVLVDGDVRMSAIGTLTYREGKRVLAFGHPMLDAGATRLPLCAGVIHTILPSVYESFKLFSTTDIVGTLTQDRLPGIGGELGEAPDMLPVEVSFASPVRRRGYRFEVVRHRALTPLLVAIGLVDIVLATEGVYESMTLKSEMSVTVEDTALLSVRHVFAGDDPAATLFQKVIGELTGLLNGSFRNPELTGLRFSLEFSAGRRQQTIVSARPDRRVVRPGDTVTISLGLRDPDERESTRSLYAVIPTTAPLGHLRLVVAARESLLYRESMRAPALTEPRTLRHYLTLLGRSGRENELVLAGYSDRPGLTVGSVELPAPPPSLAAVILAASGEEPVQSVSESPLFEKSYVFDEAIAGGHEIELEVRR